MGGNQRRDGSEWVEIIKRWEGSGESQRVFCERNGMAVSTFGHWRRKLGKEAEQRTGSFVRIASAGSYTGVSGGSVTRLRAGTIEVELSGAESEEQLMRLVRALKVVVG